MKRLVIVVATLAVALAMLEAPASAAAPALSATQFGALPMTSGSTSMQGGRAGCQAATSPRSRSRPSASPTATATWTGSTSTAERTSPGSLCRGRLRPHRADPALQPQAADFTDVAISCTSTWRTSSYVKRAYRGSVTKVGRKTSSRSWSRLGLGGNCNYGGYSGRLLVSCLSARSTVTYNLTAPRGSRMTGASASMKAGLFACHTSVARKQTSKRTIRLTLTTANAGGFAQCWINQVHGTYKGTRKVKVWTTHRSTRLAQWHSA